MVFLQHYFHLEQKQILLEPTDFNDIQNFKLIELSHQLNQSSHTEILLYILSCILSPLLYKCSASVVKSYRNIFHPWC